MRLAKMSGRSHKGFESIEGCFAYFNQVLPFEQFYFPILGTGNYLSNKDDHTNTTFIFRYDKKIVAIAKVRDVHISETGRVDGLYIIGNTLKVFNNTDSIEILELESVLREYDPTYNISEGPGWNIIEDKYEDTVINFLIDKEWSAYKQDRTVGPLSH